MKIPQIIDRNIPKIIIYGTFALAGAIEGLKKR